MERDAQLACLEKSPDASSLPADLVPALLDGLPGVEQQTQWVYHGEDWALARASARHGDSFVLASAFYPPSLSRALVIRAERVALSLASSLARSMGIAKIVRSPRPDPAITQACDALYGRPEVVHQWRIEARTRAHIRLPASVRAAELDSGLEVYNQLATLDQRLDSIAPERLRSMDASAGTLAAAIWLDSEQGPLGAQIAVISKRETHLLAIAVHPEHRRQGIGAALQDHFINDLSKHVRSDVLASNSAAVRLHQDQGFTRREVERITWQRLLNSSELSLPLSKPATNAALSKVSSNVGG